MTALQHDRQRQTARVIPITKQVQDPSGARMLDRLALPVSDGVHLVEVATITFCRADSNYTHVYLQDGGSILVSRTLAAVQAALPAGKVIRVHQSYVVQYNAIASLHKTHLMLNDGTRVPVARSRSAEVKARVLERVSQLTQ
jgi:two-component system LytT family response regulator